MKSEFKHKVRLFIENVYYNNLMRNKKHKNVYRSIEDKGFSIMTFNLKTDKHDDKEFNWMYRKHLCSDTIIKYLPDVVSLQEMNPHMHKYMITELSDVYNHYSADRKNRRQPRQLRLRHRRRGGKG
jgi:mRNA deadenylase 3'-5' endonuclease subunit Ccr4